MRSVGPGSACAHSFGGLCVSARYRYLSDDTGGSTASDADRSGMWRSSWKSGSSAPRMPVFLRGRRGDAVPTLTSTVSPSKTCLTTCTCPVARAAETNCAMSGSPAGMSAGVLSIDTSLRIYGGDFDLFKSTSSGLPLPRPRQYGLVRCPGSAGALAGPVSARGMKNGGWARNHSPLASRREARVGGGGPSDKSPIHVTNPHYPTHAGRDARGPQIRAGPPLHCPMPARAPALPGHRTNPYWRGRGIGRPDEVDLNRSKSPP